MTDAPEGEEREDGLPEPSAGRAEEPVASAYAPPPRRGGLRKNPNMVAVAAVLVVAVIVFVVALVL